MSETQYPEWVQTESERKIHDHFIYFMWLVWSHLGFDRPTKRQIAIGKYLQYCTNPRRMVQAWRGAAKTWITCTYALWRLYRNPQERIKIVSANEDKALENAIFIRRLIAEIPELQFLRPGSNCRDSALAFDVGPARANPTPSVTAVGITGQLTGGRATILISDDVEVPKNSYTESMRERLAELIKEYDALVVPEGFTIIYLGTPQTEQSIYNQVRQRGYDCRIWPARFPTLDQISKYGDALADDIVADLLANPQLVGTSTEPERFSDADLLAREMSYGRSGFALQFMLDTSLSDALRYPLKLADLIVMDVPRDLAPVRLEWTSDPRNAITDLPNPGFSGDRFYRPLSISEERTEWQGTIMYVDPSGRGKDETAYVVLRQCNGMLYLTATGGFRDGYSNETLEGLVAIAREHAVNKILIEPNMGDGMFAKLLEPVANKLYPVTIEEAERAQTQKERRIIETLEPALNQHRLVCDAAVIRADLQVDDPKYSLFYQLTHITKERGALAQDDRLDALAGAVAYFRDQLARDTARAECEHRARLQEQELEAFMARCRRPVARQTFHGMPRGLQLSSPRGVLRKR